jgi:hypothetical protein
VAESDRSDTSIPVEDPYPPRDLVAVLDHNGTRVAWTTVERDGPLPTFTEPAVVRGIEQLGWTVARRRLRDPLAVPAREG